MEIGRGGEFRGEGLKVGPGESDCVRVKKKGRPKEDKGLKITKTLRANSPTLSAKKKKEKEQYGKEKGTLKEALHFHETSLPRREGVSASPRWSIPKTKRARGAIEKGVRGRRKGNLLHSSSRGSGERTEKSHLKKGKWKGNYRGGLYRELSHYMGS